MVKPWDRLFVGAEHFNQCAALPYRKNGKTLEIALITSRGTGRWIIPKGWLEPGLKPWAAAAKEAFEEAGLSGDIGEEPVGSFDYVKRLHFLARAVCDVDVFALKVRQEHETWPEVSERQRAWFPAAEAAEAVSDKPLAEIICSFAASSR